MSKVEKKIEKLLDADRQYVWHPYTQMKDYKDRDPLFVERGEGVFLYDVYGNRYYDTISSWWAILHGHNHPVIKAHVKAQMERLEQVHFAGTTHAPAINLAQKLVELTPEPLCKVFYSDNGSTACEVAIKMSLQYWKQSGRPEKEKFISLERGYHGDTIGMLSLGGVPMFKGPFDCLTFHSHRLPTPYCYRCPLGLENHDMDDPEPACSLACLEDLEDLLRKEADKTAAIIMEPLLLGAGGMIIYPKAYLSKVAKMAKDHGVHLILDEVATGFGRTGRMFAFEHCQIVPDFLCLSKGLTGGYMPMGATVTTQEIFDAFYDDWEKGKTFFHGHTFTGNPLSSSAGLGSLEVFEKEEVLTRLPGRINTLAAGSKKISNHPNIGDIRHIGMICAFEIVQDKTAKKAFDSSKRIGFQIYLAGLKNGVILRPLGDVIYLFLPLCTTKKEIDDILGRTFDTFNEILPS